MKRSPQAILENEMPVGPARDRTSMDRRDFIILGASGFFSRPEPLRPIVIRLHVLLDQGAHSGKGLADAEVSKFQRYQEEARREFATSGILFDVHFVEGAYLRTQGYSVIPDKFLARGVINLFVTDRLGYD